MDGGFDSDVGDGSSVKEQRLWRAVLSLSAPTNGVDFVRIGLEMALRFDGHLNQSWR